MQLYDKKKCTILSYLSCMQLTRKIQRYILNKYTALRFAEMESTSDVLSNKVWIYLNLWNTGSLFSATAHILNYLLFSSPRKSWVVASTYKWTKDKKYIYICTSLLLYLPHPHQTTGKMIEKESRVTHSMTTSMQPGESNGIQ